MAELAMLGSVNFTEIYPVDFVVNKVSVKGLGHLIIASLAKSSFKRWFKYTFALSDDTRVPFIP